MSAQSITSAPIFEDKVYFGKQTDKQKPKTLGQEEFLTLLITQLKNQDPLNPMQDKEFIAQLATFSSLEQTTTMNKNIQALLKEQRFLNAASATGLIGQEVTSVDNVSGVVKAVQIDDKGVSLVIGQSSVLLSDIKTIKPLTI